MQDTFEMLQELLEQEQFELLTEEKLTEENGSADLRLVYLMNDAVESFLIFREARLTGSYIEDYQGPLKSSLSQEAERFVLVVWQGENAVTVFFKDLDLEVHLYNYGEIGHFWVQGDEYLRQLEYRIAIARDKLEYLGAEFCTETERKLVQLADFPPLNSCCYPAVPEKYIMPREDPWVLTGEALQAMIEIAEEAGDRNLVKALNYYGKHPGKITAKYVAKLLHQGYHSAAVDLLTEKIKKEASTYPDRSFGKEGDEKLGRLLDKARQLQKELEKQGIRSDILREEPFTTAKDGLDFQVFLMLWKDGLFHRTVEVKKLTEA